MEPKGGKGVSFKSLKKKTNNSDFLHLGYITRSHGVKGEVFIALLCEESSLSNKLVNKKISIRKNNTTVLNANILQIRCHKAGLIAQLEGIQKIEQVKDFIGASVFAPKSLFVSTPGQNIYLCEVEGFELHDKNRSFIGTVSGFSSNGSQDLLRIQKKQKESEVFEISFCHPLIIEVDFKAKKIFTDLPFEWPGLDDAN